MYVCMYVYTVKICYTLTKFFQSSQLIIFYCVYIYIYIYMYIVMDKNIAPLVNILNKIINAFVFAPIFLKDRRLICTQKSLFLSNSVHKSV